MQSRMPNTTMILPEAMQALLEQAKPYQSRPPAPGIACVGHKRTKDQQHPPEGVCMSVSGRLRARTGMLVMAGVCLLGATPASAAGGTGIGSGRLVPTVAAVVGLIGVVLGGLALARSAGRIGTGNGRRGAIAAGVAGLISVVVGGLHSANSAGGFGTGNGLAGAIVAMVVGLISMVLGGLALARSRRTADRLTG
jgi:uncharacterized protein DUF6223